MVAPLPKYSLLRVIQRTLSGLVCVDEGPGKLFQVHISARSTIKVQLAQWLMNEGPNQMNAIHIKPALFLTQEDCHGAILDHVQQGATMRTDGWNSYRHMDEKGSTHRREKSRRRKAAI